MPKQFAGFDEQLIELINREFARGRRVLIDNKRKSGEWRAEVWGYDSMSWFQRGRANAATPLEALQSAIIVSNEAGYTDA